MNELVIKNFNTLDSAELENIDGGSALLVGVCVIAGVSFVSGVIVGYNEVKK